jgi:hypothetical protein
MPQDIDYYLLQMAWWSAFGFNECPYLATCLKLRVADGYSLSLLSQKGIVVAPRIAPWCGS